MCRFIMSQTTFSLVSQEDQFVCWVCVFTLLTLLFSHENSIVEHQFNSLLTLIQKRKWDFKTRNEPCHVLSAFGTALLSSPHIQSQTTTQLILQKMKTNLCWTCSEIEWAFSRPIFHHFAQSVLLEKQHTILERQNMTTLAEDQMSFRWFTSVGHQLKWLDLWLWSHRVSQKVWDAYLKHVCRTAVPVLSGCWQI